MSTPATVRSRVRLALDRAWAAAEAAGTLPALPAECRGRRSRSSGRPTRSTATSRRNLAMKLARPYRDGAAGDRHGARRGARDRAPTDPASPIAEAAEVAPPGFLNLRLSRRRSWPRRSTPSSPTRRPGAGSRRPRPRRVNVEFVSANPTGPLHDRQRPRRVRRRPALPRPRGRRPAVTREYYFNDSGGQIRNLGASVRGDSAAASRSPRTATTGDYVADLAAAVPADVWAAADGARRRRGPDPRALGRRPGPGRHRGEPRPARRPLRRLDERGARSTTRAGSSGRSSGSASAATSTSRTARLWFRSTDVRRRQGPGHHPLERRADLLRRRHRLRHREVQPRLRPPHLHLGRRPPRRRSPGSRNAAEAMGYDREPSRCS